MEGYIFTWTNFIKGWRLRYAILEDNMLFISHKKTDTKNKSIEIKPNCRLIDDKKWKFSLGNIGQKLIYFKAKTMEEKEDWIQKLKISITSCATEKQNLEENKIQEKIIFEGNKIFLFQIKIIKKMKAQLSQI